MKTLTKIAILATATILLTACSSEPTESDLQKSFQAKLDESNAQFKKMMSNRGLTGDNLTKLNSFRKISCAETSTSDQYTCNVEIDVTSSMIGRQKAVTPMTVIKKDGEWLIIQ